MSQPDHDPLGLPPRLGDELRRTYAHRVAIPATVDEAVLAGARERFARRRRLRLMVRWGTGLATGLAAAIVLGIVLYRPAVMPTGPLVKGDVNADGRVDMVDALALARHVANHDGPHPGWDVNGDGAIDPKDIDAIASASVTLKDTSVAKDSLPTLHELGLDRLRVGSALADGSPCATFAKANPTATAATFAKASPTETSPREVRP